MEAPSMVHDETCMIRGTKTPGTTRNQFKEIGPLDSRSPSHPPLQSLPQPGNETTMYHAQMYFLVYRVARSPALVFLPFRLILLWKVGGRNCNVIHPEFLMLHRPHWGVC
jgi:hypothetical protein